MTKRFAVAVVLCSILLGMTTSCALFQKKTTLNAEYVRADVQFEATLGDEIAAWISEDRTLTDTEKQALTLALKSWRVMVKVSAEAEGVPHSIEVKP